MFYPILLLITALLKWANAAEIITSDTPNFFLGSWTLANASSLNISASALCCFPASTVGGLAIQGSGDMKSLVISSDSWTGQLCGNTQYGIDTASNSSFDDLATRAINLPTNGALWSVYGFTNNATDEDNAYQQLSFTFDLQLYSMQYDLYIGCTYEVMQIKTSTIYI